MSVRVLIVDDESDIRDVLAESLSDIGYVTTSCASGRDALSALESDRFDVMITDVRMPMLDGIDLCTRVASNYRIPVIVMTAFGDTAAAIDALRASAVDFITKPFEFDELVAAIRRATATNGPTPIQLLDTDDRTFEFRDLVGESAPMQSLKRQLSRVAFTETSVLITGESGTGKEVVARALHESGPRSKGPFVAVNCAAVPAQLLESELFGVERGAFTGATQSRPGLLLRANGGTLFLDEVGAMPLEFQSAFLRVLQERVVRAVGGTREEPFDVRVVAATNHDLEAAAQRGEFRAALLFRLNVVSLHVRPLRERPGDVLLLARHFLEFHSKTTGARPLTLSDAASAALSDYSWPGNVRELSNCIQVVAALARGPRVELAELPGEIRAGREPKAASADPATSLGELKQEQIERVLRAVGGNKAEAARVLGIDRVTLYRRIKRSSAERRSP